ncbi:uncharacterized protein LOC111061458 [Nilaparvata lugens]|uniref:uncharacterized protein LOC111061458 n=1 Tax=Nilaparvata lugens TaxID=108931 RepID=UPI00193E6A11|nr:uncharacterized protein LOC111061458 [Nilaparvata lugens]
MRNTNITTADDNTCGRHSPVRPKTPPLSGDSTASPHPPAPLLHQEVRRPDSGDVITPRADMPALRNARVSVRRRLFIEHQDCGDSSMNLNNSSQDVACGRKLSQDGLTQERRESDERQHPESKQCGSLESSLDRCGDSSQNLNRSQNPESEQGESTEFSQNVKPDGIAVLSRGSCDESSQLESIHDGITELSHIESHRVSNSKTGGSIVDGIAVSSQGGCVKLDQAETDESIEILSQSKLNQTEADESNEGESQDKRFKMDESS